MAEVPIFNGGQVLQVGSPVAALSGESADELLADAFTVAGRQGVDLAAAIISANKKAKAQKDSLDTTTGEGLIRQEYERISREESARAVQVGDSNDGVSAGTRFLEQAQKAEEEVLKRFNDPTVKAAIRAGVASERAKMYGTQMATEIGKIGQSNKVRLEQIVSGYQQEVMDNPANIMLAQDKMEKMYLSYNDMADADKVKSIRDGKIALVKAGVDGYIEKARASGKQTHFEDAQKFVKYFGRDFDADTVQNLNDRIAKEKRENAIYFNQQDDQRIQMEKYNQEKDTDKAYGDTLKLINDAQGDEQQLAAIRKNLPKNPAFAHAPEKLKTLMETDFAQAADGSYESEFNRKLLVSKDYKAMRLGVDKAKVTYDAKIRMYKQLEQRQDNEKNNPILNDIDNSSRGMITSMVKLESASNAEIAKNAEAVSYYNDLKFKLAPNGKPTRSQMMQALSTTMKEYYGRTIPFNADTAGANAFENSMPAKKYFTQKGVDAVVAEEAKKEVGILTNGTRAEKEEALRRAKKRAALQNAREQETEDRSVGRNKSTEQRSSFLKEKK